MGVLGVRKHGQKKITLVQEEEYGKDHREQELHQLVAHNPILILRESAEGKRLPALTIGSYFRLGEVEADLLIVDLSGSVVLAELKRERTPRDVVAQVLDYGSRLRQLGLDGIENSLRQQGQYPEGIASVFQRLLEENPDFKDSEFDAYESFKEHMTSCIAGKELQLVIVSYSVDEDVQRVVQYLREVHGLNIYSVEFDYYTSEDHEYFVPEIVGAETRKPPPQFTDTQVQYRDFWGQLLEELRRQIPGVTREKPLPQSWLGVPIGHGGIHLEWAFHGRPRSSFEVGLHLERPDYEENRHILEILENDSAALQEEIGEQVEFQKTWGRKWSRVYATRPEGEMTDELRNWAIDTMVKFYRAFKPRLDSALKA